MRKNIDGNIFDTQTATLDKKFTFGAPGDDTGYEETLYITPEGKYFIYTNGGSKSRYTHEEITPIAREQVREWLLSH